MEFANSHVRDALGVTGAGFAQRDRVYILRYARYNFQFRASLPRFVPDSSVFPCSVVYVGKQTFLEGAIGRAGDVLWERFVSAGVVL
jgi:hypothetical protein